MRRFLASYGELVFVFALGALAQAELWLDDTWAADREELALVALAMTAILLLRLRAPVPTLVLEAAAMTVVGVVSSVEDNDPMTLVIMVLVAVYSAGAHTRGRALHAASVVVVVAVAAAVVEDGTSYNISGVLFYGVLVGGPFLVGIAMRIRRERERLLVHEREERARRAVADERTRIARELHDVVAHAISVIVLQARGARHSLADDPDDARHAIDAIERTASQALGEMRRLLAILREDGDAAQLAPEASLAHLDVLTGEIRAAGLPVELRVSGEPRELPPGLDASAYRIVQEALTNALKHAGQATAVVTVHYGADALELEVEDDGAGPQNGRSGGHGLLGMRERAAVFGGSVEAGPRTGSGFAVRASLPL
jgi:signal transduction histidine kinase